MTDRVSELIELLDLEPHPEGGHFREVFRSTLEVLPADARPARSAITTIYFLLAAGEFSRVHGVESDEVWHYYEGDPLELLWWSAEGNFVDRAILGSAGGESRPVATVPAGCWQSARPLGAYTLVGCSVGPGFDFADFQMLRDHPQARIDFLRSNPDSEWLI